MSVATTQQLDPCISRFDARHAPLWSSFVDQSANGTLFHQLEFLDYHPADRFHWHHLVLGNPGSPLALLPAAEVIVVEPDGSGGPQQSAAREPAGAEQDVRDHGGSSLTAEGRRVLWSPQGATFGGLVLRRAMGLAQTVSLVQALVQYARLSGLDELALGTVPRIYWPVADDTLEFVLAHLGFQPSVQLSHYLDLTALSWPEPIASIPGPQRNCMRKALNQGMEFGVAEGDLEVEQFYRVLAANKQRHGATAVHTLSEILALRNKFPDSIRIYTARKDGRMVAGVYCVLANSRVAYTQYIADDPACRHLEATRFVVFQMLQRLHDEGIRFVDLGPSASLPIDKTSLASFKESLGAVGCHRNLWRLSLQP